MKQKIFWSCVHFLLSKNGRLFPKTDKLFDSYIVCGGNAVDLIYM